MSQRLGHLLPALALLAAAAVPARLAAQKAATPDLSDAEVAHVAVTANTIDIELGRLAESRAQASDVRQFASTMSRDHSAVNEKATALAGKLAVTPRDNAVSQSLLADARTARASLESLTGGAFDRAYIAREVAYHEAVLNALDGLLIPTTSNAELKQLLIDVRPAFVAHLEWARTVGKSLASAR